EDRPRFAGQEQPPSAAVGRVGTTLDPARVLHAVNLPHQGHRPDLEEIGKAGLVDALVAGDVGHSPALRPGQAEAPSVMVEAAPEQAGAVMKEKAKAAFEVQELPP